MTIFIVNRDHFKSLLTYLLLLAFSHIMAALSALYYIVTCHSLSINISCMITLLRMVFIKFEQCYRQILLPIARPNRFSLTAYFYFRLKHIETLLFFFKVNKSFGKLFVAYMALALPGHLVLQFSVLRGNKEIQNKILACFFIGYVFLYSFAIHLFLVFSIKHIHRPSKPLLHIMACNQQRSERVPFGTRLKLCHQIYALHTRRRYGFTYDLFGLVSMIAFIKVFSMIN
jgi:hypothetical protein